MKNERAPITIDPDIHSGDPVFTGTRVPIKTLFEYLETGLTLEVFLHNFPSVTRANGVLLRSAETEFQVFITADQKLKYQQNLAKRKIAIVVLPTNNIAQLGALLPELLTISPTIPTIKSGDYVSLNFK